MKVLNLPIDILGCHTEGPPKRKLVLTCHVTNPMEFDLCILDAWIKVETISGLKLAEGKLFQSMYNRVDPAIIPPKENGSGAFHIELLSKVLQNIEEQRAGGDVIFLFSSRVF